MDTKIQIDTDAVLKYNNQAAEENEARTTVINKILGLMAELRLNVSGSGIKRLINSIIEDLESINKEIRNNGEGLSQYIQKQMTAYASTYEDAEAMIMNAITFIQQM